MSSHVHVFTNVFPFVMLWERDASLSARAKSPIGIMSALSAWWLLIYPQDVGGLTVWRVRLPISPTLHAGIPATWSWACVTCEGKAGIQSLLGMSQSNFFCKQVWVTWFWGCASRVPINQPCIRGGNKRVLPNCLNLLSFEQNYPNTNMTTSIAESFIKCHIEPIFHQCRLQICVSIKLADSKA